ncbi:hypothetical protein LIER_07672 [Lithospermum erythrorhizon]|uniref:Ribosomal protein L2 n=1 Tax=Lithospermum erythrorhizon TaxID=34254 RepID=A0AAV3PB33_LITER
MVTYHGKGRAKDYAPSDTRTFLRSCLLTWKATLPDREQPFFYDDHESQSPLDRALFVSLHTGRVCQRIGSEFIVEPYNPYRFSRQFGYTPTILGLNSSTRETINLPTGPKLWRRGILSRARKAITFPSNTFSHTPPLSCNTWLSELVPFEAPRSTSMKYGKAKGLPAAVQPSTLVFQSSGPYKRKRSIGTRSVPGVLGRTHPHPMDGSEGYILIPWI